MTSGSRADHAIVVDEVGPAAAALIATLTKGVGGEPWSIDTVTRILSLPGAFALVAQLGGEPSGFILVQVAADESEILNFVVAESSRRKGLGRALLTAAIKRARELGASAMFLEVASDNKAAGALYRKQGFKKVGIRSDYYRRSADDYTDALILRRDLITTTG